MNLLLLHENDWRPDGLAEVSGRRARHLRTVLRVAVGDEVKAGALGGAMGRARVIAVDGDSVVLRPTLDSPPPERNPFDILLAIPRPKVLRRVLQTIACLGVRKLVLVNAARVEKSYFDSPLLHPDALREELMLGLEQARDTVLPEVLLRTRFRPFIEDEAPVLWSGAAKFVAHPEDATTPSANSRIERGVVAIGPEGGWVPFELELLRAAGFAPLSAGPRALRVEVALPYLSGMLAGR